MLTEDYFQQSMVIKPRIKGLQSFTTDKWLRTFCSLSYYFGQLFDN